MERCWNVKIHLWQKNRKDTCTTKEGFIERSPIDLTAQQKRYSIAEDVTQQQQYILTHVCSDLANVFSTEYTFRASSKALELTEEEQAEVDSKTKELTQYYKATLREWLKSNREMVTMGLDHAFVNTEPHQMDIDEVVAEVNKSWRIRQL